QWAPNPHSPINSTLGPRGLCLLFFKIINHCGGDPARPVGGGARRQGLHAPVHLQCDPAGVPGGGVPPPGSHLPPSGTLRAAVKRRMNGWKAALVPFVSITGKGRSSTSARTASVRARRKASISSGGM